VKARIDDTLADVSESKETERLKNLNNFYPTNPKTHPHGVLSEEINTHGCRDESHKRS
jgi:hypothetical protein